MAALLAKTLILAAILASIAIFDGLPATTPLYRRAGGHRLRALSRAAQEVRSIPEPQAQMQRVPPPSTLMISPVM